MHDDRDEELGRMRAEVKRKAELDQASATLADVIPPVWARIHQRLQAEGFTPEEALGLVKVYVAATAGGRIIL